MRFRNLAPEERNAEQQRLAEKLTASPRGSVRGPYVVLQHSPDLADRMRHLGDFIRFEGQLPAKLKEILILLVARHWTVDYMFAVHRGFAREAGVDPAVADAIAAGERPDGLDALQQVAYDLAIELLAGFRVADATFAAARAALGEGGTAELVSFVGYYTMLAMILNTAETALPAGAEPLPLLSGKEEQ